MVGIVIDCRMGNQLFQYAFIKALSEKLGTSFYVNENLGPFTAADYFDLKGYNKTVNPLKRLIFKLINDPFKPLQSLPVGDFDGDAIEKLADNKVYHGYFQSQHFFKDISSRINSYIQVKQAYKNEFEAKYRQLFSENKVIALHVRRGDYLNLNDWWQQHLGSNNLTLPVSYYEDCIKHAAPTGNYKIVIVSDDMDFVRDAFSHLPNTVFANNSAIVDFQIIMHADVCIIANSSFAWWAAYLNPKENKQVFCPQYWLGFKIKKEYPANIIPPEWIQIAVDAA